MERAIVLSDGEIIDRSHLPVDRGNPGVITQEDTVVTSLEDIDRREAILQALDACAGNQTRAAAMLHVSRKTLVAWLDRYDIPRPRKR
jgi:DNA-binding NtrC family response regulator